MAARGNGLPGTGSFMRLSSPLTRYLAAFVALTASASLVRADALETLVLNAFAASGTAASTNAVYGYNVTVGSNTYRGGPGFGSTIPTLTGISFSIAGYPYVSPTTDGNTYIIDQHDNMDNGNFSMNINLTSPSSDYLTEQVDYGSGVGSPTGLVTAFSSTHLFEFGATTVTGEYWFAFGEVSPPSSGSLVSSTQFIGGVIQDNSDIKIFAVSAPTPSAAIGGAILMAGLAGWRLTRRMALAVA